MIDVSLKVAILRLLLKFKNELNQSMLFISHDIATAAMISDRIAVMYLGKIVEIGSTREIPSNPMHPYTKALLSAIPSIRRRRIEEIAIKGEIADPTNPPPGCRFHPRCPFKMDICDQRAMKGYIQYATKPPIEFKGPTYEASSPKLIIRITLSDSIVHINKLLWVEIELEGQMAYKLGLLRVAILNSNAEKVYDVYMMFPHRTIAPNSEIPSKEVYTFVWRASKNPSGEVEVTPGKYFIIVKANIEGKELTVKGEFTIVE
ncbi:hypothetical protein DRN84_02690 [Candidatus Geothermarchaeota archaeon]|nr:MAG: hypothetical protein DRN84_02690 [Candidatus Geothermarchaeota archaeon]